MKLHLLLFLPCVIAMTFHIDFNNNQACDSRDPRPVPAENVEFPGVTQWTGLYTRWTFSGVGGVPGAANHLPLTQAAAQQAGWRMVESCDSGFANVYKPPASEDRVTSRVANYLVFDNNGEPAGVIDVSEVLTPFRQQEAWFPYDGTNALLAWFTNPYTVCNRPTTRTTIGDRVWIQKGMGKYKNQFYKLPMHRDEAKIDYPGQACVTTMGDHLTNFDTKFCDPEGVLPSFQLLYHPVEGYLIGWVSNIITAFVPHDGWEFTPMSLSQGTGAKKASQICDNIPETRSFLASDPANSLHHWFINPAAVVCPDQPNPLVSASGCPTAIAGTPEFEALAGARIQTLAAQTLWADAPGIDPKPTFAEWEAAADEWASPSSAIHFLGSGIWGGLNNRAVMVEYYADSIAEYNQGWSGGVNNYDFSGLEIDILPSGTITMLFPSGGCTYDYYGGENATAEDRRTKWRVGTGPERFYFSFNFNGCETKITDFTVAFSSACVRAGATGMPSPATLCDRIQTYCTGANGTERQFATREECVLFYQKRNVQGCNDPLGMYKGDSQSCRFLHTMVLDKRPEVHCPHVGPGSTYCRADSCIIPSDGTVATGPTVADQFAKYYAGGGRINTLPEAQLNLLRQQFEASNRASGSLSRPPL
eukprot:TRINITY_DN95582_c0_g1_i1.p1 TRINITY_DN95582_c0_g1~~TRINITY_DN95582_c0_g1_i1.p1  ORF type:complete len:646 (+),score=76.30 TRINITY_DN95582_c0_g1_i1:20-1957(+)